MATESSNSHLILSCASRPSTSRLITLPILVQGALLSRSMNLTMAKLFDSQLYNGPRDIEAANLVKGGDVAFGFFEGELAQVIGLDDDAQ